MRITKRRVYAVVLGLALIGNIMLVVNPDMVDEPRHTFLGFFIQLPAIIAMIADCVLLGLISLAVVVIPFFWFENLPDK